MTAASERRGLGEHQLARQSWLMLAGAFAAFTISAAMMHSYTVFLVAFVEAFAWTRAEISVPYSVSQIVAGASSPLVGALVDRLGPRRLMLLGVGLLVTGLLASAAVAALWHIILLYGVVMTIGANCLGLVVFVPLLSRLFVRRRGMALSIVQSANGLARAASAPLAQLSITLIGWRGTYLAEAALMAVLGLPLALLFRRTDRPARPPSPQPLPATPTGERSWTLAEAARTRHFWLLFVVYLCTGLGSFLVSLHQLAFAVSVGFDKLYAASVLGVGALLAIAGSSSPAPCPTISAANSRRFSPTASRSSASSARS